MPLDPQSLYASLLARGFRAFTGVPCSILDPLIIEAEASPEVDYLPASVEGEAVAAAAGAWLAGSRGVVLLQNSGLGNAINPLATLAIPYRIPLLLISSWRGEPGREDAVHHHPMGAATPGLLGLFDIPVTVLREDTDLDTSVAEALSHMTRTRLPAALIVPRGIFAKRAAAPDVRSMPPSEDFGRGAVEVARFGHGSLPTRSAALRAFLAHRGDAAVVSTTGYMSRELSAHLCERFFPMQGSMGFALAIALGIASIQRERPLFVLDGDGALIMRLGSLASTGAAHPSHLVHIVFDNAIYASTGGQKTVSPSIDFPGVAAHCGYRRVASCQGSDGLEKAMLWAAEAVGSGPALLHVAIDRTEAQKLDRPDLTPPEIAENFRAFLTRGGGIP